VKKNPGWFTKLPDAERRTHNRVVEDNKLFE
jgi:hypothetical protein